MLRGSPPTLPQSRSGGGAKLGPGAEDSRHGNRSDSASKGLAAGFSAMPPRGCRAFAEAGQDVRRDDLHRRRPALRRQPRLAHGPFYPEIDVLGEIREKEVFRTRLKKDQLTPVHLALDGTKEFTIEAVLGTRWTSTANLMP